MVSNHYQHHYDNYRYNDCLPLVMITIINYHQLINPQRSRLPDWALVLRVYGILDPLSVTWRHQGGGWYQPQQETG